MKEKEKERRNGHLQINQLRALAQREKFAFAEILPLPADHFFRNIEGERKIAIKYWIERNRVKRLWLFGCRILGSPQLSIHLSERSVDRFAIDQMNCS
jgi:hypothetical protein